MLAVTAVMTMTTLKAERLKGLKRTTISGHSCSTCTYDAVRKALAARGFRDVTVKLFHLCRITKQEMAGDRTGRSGRVPNNRRRRGSVSRRSRPPRTARSGAVSFNAASTPP